MSQLLIPSLLVIFLAVMCSQANAYVENVQLQDQDGKTVSVGLENPSVTTIKSGWFSGSIQTSNVQVVESNGIQNFVSQIKPTQVGSEVDFAGKLDSTGTIKLVDNSGQSWSLILEPQVEAQTSQDTNNTTNMPSIPYYVYGIVVLIGVGTVMLIKRRGKIGEITRV
jgi:hypothetical protein